MLQHGPFQFSPSLVAQKLLLVVHLEALSPTYAVCYKPWPMQHIFGNILPWVALYHTFRHHQTINYINKHACSLWQVWSCLRTIFLFFLGLTTLSNAKDSKDSTNGFSLSQFQDTLSVLSKDVYIFITSEAVKAAPGKKSGPKASSSPLGSIGDLLSGLEVRDLFDIPAGFTLQTEIDR